MLSKEYRLKKRSDFNLVFKKGRSVSNRFLEIRFKSLEEKKIAFVAPVSNFKKAATRNKIKRRLRESFREIIDDVKNETGIIVIAKKPIEDKNLKETEEIIKNLLVKAKLLRK